MTETKKGPGPRLAVGTHRWQQLCLGELKQGWKDYSKDELSLEAPLMLQEQPGGPLCLLRQEGAIVQLGWAGDRGSLHEG